ncbi:hypothetical protein DBR00_08240 [Pseudomonas sp. HMWF032]|nr:hypothetical protein DBR00_08240 [Pseudomonas sp. HMWF032]PTT85094.1 hypothetical protein DBR41_05330 [Pseudomonas sp. HMWF010]
MKSELPSIAWSGFKAPQGAVIASSNGGAPWPPDSSNLAEALEQVDQALYRTQHARKNCAVLHGA